MRSQKWPHSYANSAIRILKKRYNLNRHIAKLHTPQGDVVCFICKPQFKCRRYLNQHLLKLSCGASRQQAPREPTNLVSSITFERENLSLNFRRNDELAVMYLRTFESNFEYILEIKVETSISYTLSLSLKP